MLVELFGDCPRAIPAYVVGENHPNRFCGFLDHNDFLGILVFEESEGWDGYDSLFLLLSVTGSDSAAAISGVKIVYQSFESDNQVVVFVEGINVFGRRDDADIVFSQVVDEQGGLCTVSAQPR